MDDMGRLIIVECVCLADRDSITFFIAIDNDKKERPHRYWLTGDYANDTGGTLVILFSSVFDRAETLNMV